MLINNLKFGKENLHKFVKLFYYLYFLFYLYKLIRHLKFFSLINKKLNLDYLKIVDINQYIF